jgi:alanine dehydrogenase
MLLINNELVSQLLTMDDCIRVQEEAFRKLVTGGAIHRPRIDMYFPASAGMAISAGARWKGERRLFCHP